MVAPSPHWSAAADQRAHRAHRRSFTADDPGEIPSCLPRRRSPCPLCRKTLCRLSGGAVGTPLRHLCSLPAPGCNTLPSKALADWLDGGMSHSHHPLDRPLLTMPCAVAAHAVHPDRFVFASPLRTLRAQFPPRGSDLRKSFGDPLASGPPGSQIPGVRGPGRVGPAHLARAGGTGGRLARHGLERPGPAAAGAPLQAVQLLTPPAPCGTSFALMTVVMTACDSWLGSWKAGHAAAVPAGLGKCSCAGSRSRIFAGRTAFAARTSSPISNSVSHSWWAPRRLTHS